MICFTALNMAVDWLSIWMIFPISSISLSLFFLTSFSIHFRVWFIILQNFLTSSMLLLFSIFILYFFVFLIIAVLWGSFQSFVPYFFFESLVTSVVVSHIIDLVSLQFISWLLFILSCILFLYCSWIFLSFIRSCVLNFQIFDFFVYYHFCIFGTILFLFLSLEVCDHFLWLFIGMSENFQVCFYLYGIHMQSIVFFNFCNLPCTIWVCSCVINLFSLCLKHVFVINVVIWA